MNDEDVIKLLWQEYELRQKNYWNYFNRFTLAIVTISIIPYVKPDVKDTLGKLIVVFPFATFLIALLAMWLLGAEYQRMSMIRKKYDELLGPKYQIPRMPEKTCWQKIVKYPIGSILSLLFGIGFTLLSLANFIVLKFYLLKPMD
jgi:hypothetical protein